MTQQTAVGSHIQPDRGGRGPSWLRLDSLRVTWSRPAAIRALCAMVIVPGLLALCLEVIGNPQMTIFAVFGAFGVLLFASFDGSRRDKAIAYLGLTIAGCLALTVGTLVSGSAWLAVVVTIPFAFTVFFAGVAGPNAASGVTAILLIYVLPVASATPTSVIPWRLAGWLLACGVGTGAVVLFFPRSASHQLSAAAAASAAALARHLEAAVAGTATRADLEASVAANRALVGTFSSAPNRPTGLTTAYQALSRVVHMLEWCTSLTCDAMGGHLDLSMASEQDRRVLAEAATALRTVAEVLTGRETACTLEPIWRARVASAEHMLGLTGAQPTLRRQVGYAYHAQTIGLAASSAAADAMIASGRASKDLIAKQRQRWVDGLTFSQAERPQPRRPMSAVADLFAADATSRSVWFRNSARGAIAIAVAVAIARLTNVQHGFWVVLGTLSVLRNSAAATGSTALRALVGTALGFVIGAGLLIAIGSSEPVLWAVYPLAVLIATYTPGTAPFAAGQAAFTVAIVVLFNLLHPAGWRVGLIRIEDVALGCAVSAVVGILFWPRGAASVMGDNLADALRSGADYLTESARCVLHVGKRHPDHAMTAINAGTRLDDAIRTYLTEQGSKRLAKEDMWALVMAAQRIRLTAHSLASLPARQHSTPASTRARLGVQSADLAVFYDRIATQVGPPARGQAAVTEVAPPAGHSNGAVSHYPDAIWVQMHLEQLGSHAAALSGPAARLAAIRRTAWWRAAPTEPRSSG
jgi:uncharacterized membrane protein YccC